MYNRRSTLANNKMRSVLFALLVFGLPIAAFAQCERTCNRGQYLDNANQNNCDCKNCPNGQYQTSNSHTSQSCPYCSASDCDDNKYQTGCSRFSGTTCEDCSSCGRGQRSTCTNSDKGGCVDCAQGQYQNSWNHDSNSCKGCGVCGAGEYTNCGPIIKGTCLSCPNGQYKTRSDRTTKSCQPCTSTCPPGSGALTEKCDAKTGAAICQTCANNKYSDANDLSGCKTCALSGCSEGWEPTAKNGRVCNANTGQDLCKQCAPGYYKQGTGRNKCLPCPANSYQDSPGKGSCKPCSTCGQGQKLKQVCARDQPPPASNSAALCDNCEANRDEYQDSSAHYDLTCKECTSCGPGEFRSSFCSSTSNFVCQTCTEGKYQDEASHVADTCKDCTAKETYCGNGTYRNTLRCYPKTGFYECATCGAGTYKMGYNTDSRCTPCDNSVCPKETYRTGECTPTKNDWVCRPCDNLDCAAGKERVGTCQEVDDEGRFTCQDCPSGQYRNTRGITCNLQNKNLVCDEGLYIVNWLSLTEAHKCGPCPNGQYSDKAEGGKTKCIEKPFCSQGHRLTNNVSKTNKGACVPCSGTCNTDDFWGEGSYFYQDEKDHRLGECIVNQKFCGEGQRISDCSLNELPQCFPCEANTFRVEKKHREIACEQPKPCNAGFYLVDKGPKEEWTCEPCQPGYYQNESNFVGFNCTICPYQNGGCPLGSRISGQCGQDINTLHCEQCPVHYFGSNDKHRSVMNDVNKMVPDAASDPCQRCSKSCSSGEYPAYKDSVGCPPGGTVNNVECEKCDVGEFLSRSNLTQTFVDATKDKCLRCGKAEPFLQDDGSPMDQKKWGYYQDEKGKTDCKTCRRFCHQSVTETQTCDSAHPRICFDLVPPVLCLNGTGWSGPSSNSPCVLKNSTKSTEPLEIESLFDTFDIGNGDPVKAFDADIDGDIDETDKIIRESDSLGLIDNSGLLVTTLLGKHRIWYTVSDESGNAADSVYRDIVIRDTTPPTIEAQGHCTSGKCPTQSNVLAFTPIVLDVSQEYSSLAADFTERTGLFEALKLGACACDKRDRALGQEIADSLITLDSDVVDIRLRARTLGNFSVQYRVVDSQGNKAEVQRTVVLVDMTPPNISLIGNHSYNSPYHMEANVNQTEYIDPGAVAVDIVDGDVTDRVIVSGIKNVTNTQLGFYIVKYTADDKSGNTQTASRVVEVKDTTPPTMELLWGANLSTAASDENVLFWNYGIDWQDPGFLVRDNFDVVENLTTKVEGNVNPLTPLGETFELKYFASDMSENSMVPLTRIVEIVDTLPPNISLLGDSDVTIYPGGKIASEAPNLLFAEPGIEVHDLHDFVSPLQVITFNDEPDIKLVQSNPAAFGPGAYRSGYREMGTEADGELSVMGRHEVSYAYVDSSFNVGLSKRIVTIVQAEASKSEGLSTGGQAGIAIFVLLIIFALVGVAFWKGLIPFSVNSQKTDLNSTLFSSPVFTLASGAPPPESWYHGEINRITAEDRLRGAGQASGAYLVRARKENESELVISLLFNNRPIHYVLETPPNDDRILFQKKPIKWGTSCKEVIEHLMFDQEELPCPLRHAVRPPDRSDDMSKLAEHFGRGHATRQAYEVLYNKMISEPSRYDLGCAFNIAKSGVFYRVFRPLTSVGPNVKLYTRSKTQFVQNSKADAMKMPKNIPLYIRVDPKRFAEALGLEIQEDQVTELWASGDVVYDATAPSVLTGVAAPADAYSKVNKGSEASDVIYSAVVVDGTGDSATEANPENEGDVLYTSLAMAQGEGSTSFDDRNYNEGEVLYTSVELGKSSTTEEQQEEPEVLYTSLALDDNREQEKNSHQVQQPDKHSTLRRPGTIFVDQGPEEDPEWLHHVGRKEAEARLRNAGGQEGMFLVRPREGANGEYAFSVVVMSRFIHRLIQPAGNGKYTVDKQPGPWGSNVNEVVNEIVNTMNTKHKMNLRAVPRPENDLLFC
eukprot:m.325977 g.325977  ORF g.325977 m.325977 type:complete len:1954 (+) comp16555_c0_seq1:129-5990(+)